MAESDISQNTVNEHHEEHHEGRVPQEKADEVDIHGSQAANEHAQHDHHQEEN